MARNKYDVDEVLEDSFDLNQLKRLAHYISPYNKPMALVVVLMLSSSALTMLVLSSFRRLWMKASLQRICAPLLFTAS